MTQVKKDKNIEKTDGLSEQQVSDFLFNNPDFLEDNPEILKSMKIPSRWGGDGVADMQKFMLEQLRGEIDNLRECAQDVIETSRTNMSVQTRTHTAVLALLFATDVNQLTNVIIEDFPLLLDVDVAILGFETNDTSEVEQKIANAMIYSSGTVDQLIGHDQDILLMQNVTDDGKIFGEGAGLVHSAALARLRPGRHMPTGMLALGARNSAFQPSQGTELISFLARVLERSIDLCLATKK